MVILSARHRPVELSILVATLLTGVLNVFSVEPTRTIAAIEEVLPGYSWVWYIGVSVGSIIGLCSAFMKIPDALLVERVGLVMLCAFFFAYGFGSLSFPGASGFSGTFYLLAFAFGFMFRVRQLNHDICLLKRIGIREDNGE